MDVKCEKKQKKIWRKVIILVILLALAAAVFVINENREAIALMLYPEIAVPSDITKEKAEPVIDVEYVSKKLENISSLQTAEITFGCVTNFEEGSVTFITKKAFTMYYEATVSAGIDVSEISVIEEDGKYIVSLPHAKICDKPFINHATLTFYNKSEGLFTNIKPEDTAKALQYAENDVLHQATTEQLCELADKNAQDIISNLLLCFLDEDAFSFVFGSVADVPKISPPISSADALEYDGKDKDFKDLKKEFKNAGFTNISCSPIKNLRLGWFTKDGAVESISIDGSSSFTESQIFDSDAKVVIKYHTKVSD